MPTDRALVNAVARLFKVTQCGIGRWLTVAAGGVFVANLFYLGSKPFAVGLIPSPWDKLAHLLAFGIIAGLLWLGLLRKHPVWVILVVTLIGGVDELHQYYFLPGRSGDVYDLLADMWAALLAVSILHTVNRALTQRNARR